ncbi:hypothetical protein BU14_0167s0019 [Porphyra umbilicalis]|uniref:Clathrin/coatomer adaptor adaptin-like N-terminal domain-containing protein n=1 Tax=Porphyra umbilicalis TaxID=2786 RepID=A0A1X6P801_PORUM|nr:hypothetical protein BU14_0167s0019 [Porphyra umbilicalis]|eukprot:OSX76947.1 hypothetical protein BU14_0167s0019 [Porphyra umbilicalis]
MNYLSGALSYIAGNDAPPSPSSSSTVSAISRLVDRTASSALPADRRSAVTSLAELALRGPDAQREIGVRGLKVLYAVIEQDAAHEDTVTAALTLLARICGAASVAADNTAAWVALDGAVDLILGAVDVDDAGTRAAALDALAALLDANADAAVPPLLDASPPPAGRLLEATRDAEPGVRLRALGVLAATAGASAAAAAALASADGYGRLLDVADACVDNALHEGGPAEAAHQAAVLAAAVTAVNAMLAAGGAAGAAAARRSRAVPRLGCLSAGVTSEVLGLAFDAGGDGGGGGGGAPPRGVPPLPPDVRVAALMAVAALARGHPPTHTLFPSAGVLPPPETPHSAGASALAASPYACVRAATAVALGASLSAPAGSAPGEVSAEWQAALGGGGGGGKRGGLALRRRRMRA